MNWFVFFLGGGVGQFHVHVKLWEDTCICYSAIQILNLFITLVCITDRNCFIFQDFHLQLSVCQKCVKNYDFDLLLTNSIPLFLILKKKITIQKKSFSNKMLLVNSKIKCIFFLPYLLVSFCIDFFYLRKNPTISMDFNAILIDK